MALPISPSTWNTLGLGVAGTWFALGLVGVLQPARTAEIFGISSGHPCGTAEESAAAARQGMALLLGSRDFTIGAALLALGASKRHDEMGTVILSTMIICAADIYLVWKAKRFSE